MIGVMMSTQQANYERNASMNPTAISTIIAAASFIMTIFTAVHLNQRHIDKLMEQMDKRLQEMDQKI